MAEPARPAPAASARAAYAAVDLIRAKRDGVALTGDEIRWLIGAYLSGEVAEEQMSALLMAVYFRGLDAPELRSWTSAMVDSGERLDLGSLARPTVDKHSTGGVGDKVSLDPRAAGGRLRRGRAAAVRPRARPHRRHAGQAGVHPRLAGRPAARRDGGHPAPRGLRDLRGRARPGPGRPAPVRAARRHRDGRVDPAHRELDHVQEDRRGHRGAGARRQGRQRRVHARR